MDGRLFFPDDPQLQLDLAPAPPPQAKKRHLEVVRACPVDPRVRLMGDGAGEAEAQDGLPARAIAPHSAKKAWMVGRYLNTVSRAMGRKWFAVNYVELFCGPGILLDRYGDEQPGSPLQAVAVDHPFERYVFCDGNDTYTDAVQRRMPRSAGTRIEVFPGDANEREHLEKVARLLDPRALVIVYLDPAKPNLDFETIKFFAARFEHLDLIINLPFVNINRALSVKSTEWPGRFLNHPDPLQLRRDDPFSASRAIRNYFLDQLRALGLDKIVQNEVKTSKAPLYDIVLASRDSTAKKLWLNANRVEHDGQVGLNVLP